MFVGSMLTLAREAAGLTQGVLAHVVGISQAHLSKIEHGLERPSDELVERLAVECSVPVGFLCQTEVIHGQGVVDIFHRKRATLPAKPLRKATATVNMMRMEVSRLTRNVELTNLAPFPVLPEGETSPSDAAEFVRATWRVPTGPLPNLVDLIEATGTPVVLAEFGHRKLAAMSMPDPHHGLIIALNKGLPASNRRWSLAHELGHAVLHSGAASADVEREADEFASALLMPNADIRPAIKRVKFSELGGLKVVWRVSLAALIRKAHDLGEITDRQYRTFNMGLNQLPGGRMHEPGEFPPEVPRLVTHLIEYFQSDRGYSLAEVAEVMRCSEQTLRVRYLDEPARSLRPVGGSRTLYRVPSPPSR